MKDMLKTLAGKEALVARVAQMLSGYDDATWANLREHRRSTYRRAAETLIHDWGAFADMITPLVVPG